MPVWAKMNCTHEKKAYGWREYWTIPNAGNAKTNDEMRPTANVYQIVIHRIPLVHFRCLFPPRAFWDIAAPLILSVSALPTRPSPSSFGGAHICPGAFLDHNAMLQWGLSRLISRLERHSANSPPLLLPTLLSSFPAMIVRKSPPPPNPPKKTPAGALSLNEQTIFRSSW